MNDWTSGYVTDIPYTATFYHDQSPAHLNFICLLNGFHPRSIDKGFNYCELGCGCGLTTNVLAATNPHGQFFAVDFQPAHIAEALDMAKRAGLENVKFFDQSFKEFLNQSLAELPALDFITMHGVYSWISPDDQRQIIEIIHRKLKPGGILYTSYNSLPGWIGGQPIQKLLYECGRLFSDRSDRRFEKALSLLKDIRNEKSPILSNDELFDRIMDIQRTGRVRYLTHEYLSENWHPQYHADVARQLSAAKLTFVGSANVLDNFPDLNYTKDRQTLLSQIGNPELQETLKDYFVPRLLRKDVYVRGPLRLNKIRQGQLLKQMSLALIVPRHHVQLTLKVPIGEVTVSESVFTSVVNALVERPRTMAELLTLSGPHENPAAKAAEIAGILTGTWQTAPTVAAETAAAQDAIDRFNLAVTQKAILEDVAEQFPLASPILGSAVQASGLEMHVYQAVQHSESIRADELAALLWRQLAERGQRLVKNGIPLEAEDENLALIRETIKSVLEHKLPVWQNLGILKS